MSGEGLWWKEGVIYQIYPRSFMDSNDDGIGDIPGIIEKLDYLQDLGIDGIWLSPIYTSPMYDFGYDVSDYRSIDPVFGSDADFDRLVREAHRRKIRIIMDMVVNHTSHEHPWFQESRSSRNNPKRDWYLWHNGINGKPPNNWLGAFGGRAWEWDAGSRSFYYHAFLPQQPDLNWMNQELRRAVYNEFRYWMERGVDGFRLDVVNFYVKDQKLRNNPFGIGMSPRPYDLQKHIYDRNRPELFDILRELRREVDAYPERMLVGEAYAPPPGDAEFAAACTGNGNDMLYMAFDFSLIYAGKWEASRYLELLQRWYGLQPEKGWPCLVMSNHDQSRVASRIGSARNMEGRLPVAAALLLLARGTPFMYYGEEIGMTDGRIPKGMIQDPVGLKYWPLHKGRDPFRTPMQWKPTPGAGFTKGTPWLPINSDYRVRNVAAQRDSRTSLLSVYRELIDLRRRHESLRRGEFLPFLEGQQNVLGFYRTTPAETCAVLLNFSPLSRSVSAGDSQLWEVIYTLHGKKETLKGLNMILAPGDILVARRIGANA